MNDVVRVLEDAQQMVPVQVALHPRRIVVDAERQVGLAFLAGEHDLGGAGALVGLAPVELPPAVGLLLLLSSAALLSSSQAPQQARVGLFH